MHRRHSRWAALTVAVALTLSACGGTAGGGDTASGMDHQDGHPSQSTATSGAGPQRGHDQPAPAPVEGAREITVKASAFRFEPAQLTVPAGQPVNIVLASTDILHDFTVEGQGFHLAAEAGQTAAGGLTIDEPGIYTVYCSVTGHREAGMELVLTVERV